MNSRPFLPPAIAISLVLLLAISHCSAQSPERTQGHSSDTVQIEEEIPADSIKATASSEYSPQQPVGHLIDGAGMQGMLHDNNSEAVTMWHTAVSPADSVPADGLPASPAWVRFDFDKARTLKTISIWNHNQAGTTDRGFKSARLLGSVDGKHWFAIAADGKDHIVIPRAGGDASAASSLTINIGSQPFKSVLIAADSKDGNYGSNVYGLSAVKFYTARQVSEKDLPIPNSIDCELHPYYLHRADGKPGRAATLVFKNTKLYGPATFDYSDDAGNTETFTIAGNRHGTGSFDFLLPAGVGVDAAVSAKITLHAGQVTVQKAVTVSPQREWTVYLYPQSHVDIGFTTTQDFVRQIHERNVDVGIDMGRSTTRYPEGSRSVWNTEAQWVVESYLRDATPEKKAAFIDAVKRGWIGLDANYDNANTSIFSDEEFLRFFHHGMQMRQLTGAPVDTMVQFDVPAMSWGVVQAAAQCGVRGVFSFENDAARIGKVREYWEQKPFWWIAPDGKTRVFFLQGPNYATSIYIKGAKVPFKPYRSPQDKYPESQLGRVPVAAVQDFRRDMDRIRTENPSALFLDPFIFQDTARLERGGCPYDIYVMAWCMWDNAFVDGDLPDAVKAWNEKYAYPKVIISSAHDILQAYEKKFGEVIPKVRGDYTEYWTDGIGSDARRTGYNRLAKERLVDAQTMFTMLHPDRQLPVAGFDDAWRYVMLGSEHTWGYYVPGSPFAKAVEAVKASDFENANKSSIELMATALRPIERSGGNNFAVVNTLSFPRTEVVTVHAEGNRVIDDAGHDVPAQRLSSGDLAFLASDIPALSSRMYRVISGNYSGKQITATSDSLDNGIVKVSLNPASGDIASLLFNQHEFVDPNSAYQINAYRYLQGGDAPEKASAPSEVTIKLKESGPLVASLLVESKAQGCNKLTREIRLTAGDARVDCIDILDKIATRNKEGVHFAFPFNVPAGTTRMDIPWGVMIPEVQQLPGGNRNWLTFQRWVDVSNDRDGVTWTCAEMPLIEFGQITANIMGMATGSKQWLEHIIQPQSTIFSWALNNHWFTNFPLQQSGILPFHYSILPHGSYDPALANRFGLRQTHPLVAVPCIENPIKKPILNIDNPRVFISAIKPSEDGTAMILRLRSVSPEAETVHLDWPGGAPKSIHFCLADEVPGEITEQPILIAPYGALGLRLQFK